jgi:DNA-binding transcriptional LysR family regulator
MPATAIMRRDHPLAKRAFVRASDLAAERLVAVEPRMGIRDVMEEMFSAEGLELRPQLTATNIDIACQLVNRTNAITVAEPLVPLTLDSEAFAFVPMKPLHTVHVGIVTPPLKPDSRLTTLFKASLREEAKAIEQRLARRLVNPNGREARRPGGAKLKTRRKSQPRYE